MCKPKFPSENQAGLFSSRSLKAIQSLNQKWDAENDDRANHGFMGKKYSPDTYTYKLLMI